MRIGVFGGSFDPIHLAHLIVAGAAAEQLELDQVRFVPAAGQPFKPEGHAASAPDRVAMVELALRDDPRFVLDRREIERGGVSYTVDTLADLHHDLPNDELFLLVGADTARDLSRWHKVSTIGRLARIVAMSRAGSVPPDTPEIAQAITVPSVDISASAVRLAVRDGKSIRKLVPDAMDEYIRTHALYDNEA